MRLRTHTFHLAYIFCTFYTGDTTLHCYVICRPISFDLGQRVHIVTRSMFNSNRQDWFIAVTLPHGPISLFPFYLS
jgi:hypothetical protein